MIQMLWPDRRMAFGTCQHLAAISSTLTQELSGPLLAAGAVSSPPRGSRDVTLAGKVNSRLCAELHITAKY